MSSLKPCVDALYEGVDRVAQSIPGVPKSEVFLVRLLMLTSGALLREFESKLKPYGMNDSDFRTLMMIYSSEDGSATPGELCALAEQKPTNMTRIANALAKKDLISRSHATHDRRQVLLRITPAGRRFVNKMLPPMFPPRRSAASMTTGPATRGWSAVGLYIPDRAVSAVPETDGPTWIPPVLFGATPGEAERASRGSRASRRGRAVRPEAPPAYPCQGSRRDGTGCPDPRSPAAFQNSPSQDSALQRQYLEGNRRPTRSAASHRMKLFPRSKMSCSRRVLLARPSCRTGTLAASYFKTKPGNMPGGMLRTAEVICEVTCATAISMCTLAWK